MKIRLGFVSNSSSASYQVLIKNTSLDEIFEVVDADFQADLDPEEEIKILDEAIEAAERRMSSTLGEIKAKLKGKAKTSQDIMNRAAWRIYGYEYNLQKKDKVQNATTLEKREKLKVLLFELKGVNVIEKGSDIELHCQTSMHNNYDEGMPHIVQEIMLDMIMRSGKTVQGTTDNS